MNNIKFNFNIKISKSETKDLDNEIWKEINNHNNYTKYFISNYGRIKSITNNKIKLLKTNISNGYERVQIAHKMFFIHRLVALYFIDNPYDFEQVNHKDFNKLNNKVENLEWVSSKMNVQYTSNSVIQQIDILTNKVIAEYNSTTNAANAVNGDRARIHACCYNKRGCKTHKGYIWKYKFKPNSFNKGTNKRIIQLDKNNNIICSFNSISDACKKLNVCKTGIQNVLKGYSKYYKGYIFKYD